MIASMVGWFLTGGALLVVRIAQMAIAVAKLIFDLVQPHDNPLLAGQNPAITIRSSQSLTGGASA
jgi:hypothetical protein